MSVLATASHDEYTQLYLPLVVGSDPLGWVRGQDEQLGGIYLAEALGYQFCDVCGCRCFLKVESVFLSSCCWWCWAVGKNEFRNMLPGIISWDESARGFDF